MGKIIARHLPCLSDECGSSDARSVYEDGTSFCFSCQSWFPKQDGEDLTKMSTPQKKAPDFFKKVLTTDEVQEYPIRGFKDRQITKHITEFFGVRVSYGDNGEVDTHYYPYDNGDAYKVRKLPKDFTWVNKSTGLFGKEKFNGAGRRLIITEGEIDALSMAQASYDRYQKIYPVVAMSSSVMTKSLLENRDWIRSFGEVILCLDNDEAGQKATEEAIKIIGIDKVKLAKLPEKDPNEVLLKHGGNTLLQCVFDAAPHVPAGIITKEALWEALVTYSNTPSVPYPVCIGGLNAKTKGMRMGEIALFVSGTSCGKSTIMREIMLHVAESTTDKVGVVSLEEAPAETARKLAGMALHKNPAEEEIPLEVLKEGFDKVFGSDKFIVLDHQGSLKDETILDKIEYMALSGCKYIIIDHITILVSEGAEGLTGNEAIDKVMNDLLRFVKRHNVWIGLVSHLRKTTNTGKAFEEGRMPNLDDIKGSGSIKQISFDIIAFARNLMDADVIKRNTIDMAVLKCRYTGLTGGISGAYYDYSTGRFKEAIEAPVEDFVTISVKDQNDK
jgi:twinkle protein